MGWVRCFTHFSLYKPLAEPHGVGQLSYTRFSLYKPLAEPHGVGQLSYTHFSLYKPLAEPHGVGQLSYTHFSLYKPLAEPHGVGQLSYTHFSLYKPLAEPQKAKTTQTRSGACTPSRGRLARVTPSCDPLDLLPCLWLVRGVLDLEYRQQGDSDMLCHSGNGEAIHCPIKSLTTGGMESTRSQICSATLEMEKQYIAL